MNQRKNTIRCVCAKVELKAIGEPIVSTACHCEDCSKGSHQLEALPHAPAILDSFGGTPHTLFRKDRFEYITGVELLKNIQVDSDSPKRVYASCCNSYLFMDLPKPMQWVPIHSKRFVEGAPPIEYRINVKFKNKADAPQDLPSYSSVPLKFVFKLLGTLPGILFNL